MVHHAKDILYCLGSGDLGPQIAEMLLQQHVTLHTSIRKSPAELLVGCCLSTLFDQLHPDFVPDHQREPVPDDTP